ncbi:MAG TPA: plastocyanin/azurin family copper-binding protein [Dehalococcoidia bacterium]|nr:plastocyanin/azurin family copper-binding protein [Dehalococcoidia bacterium]
MQVQTKEEALAGRPRRAAWAVFAIALAAVAALAAACGGGEEAAPAGQVPTATGIIALRAGLNDPQDVNIAVLEFLPESITVPMGTTVEWQFTGPEPHTVTFFPPGQQPPSPDQAEAFFAATPPAGPYDGTALVNSGLQPLGPGPVTFRVTFARPGEYNYVCVIHPQMTGKVTVTDDASGTDSQQEVTQRGDRELQQWLQEGQQAKQRLMSQAPRQLANPDGSTTWFVEMGTTTEHTDVLAFSPVPASVRAGDRVTFINNSGAPHTATFLDGRSAPAPDSPEVREVVPGPSPQTLTIQGYFNTGLLPPNAPPGGAPPEAARSFTFVVAQPGRYTYVCLLHVPSGMAGTIQAQ